MSTKKVVASWIIFLLVVGLALGALALAGVGFWYFTSSEAASTVRYSVSEACQVLKDAGQPIGPITTTGCAMEPTTVISEVVKIQEVEVIKEVQVEVIREIEVISEVVKIQEVLVEVPGETVTVTVPCLVTPTVVMTPVVATPVVEPVVVVEPVAPVLEWSHEFSVLPGTVSVGDMDRFTYFQGWVPAEGIDSGIHVLVSPGLELVLAEGYAGNATIWLANINPGIAHLQGEVETIRLREIANGAPSDWKGQRIFIVDGINAAVPAGFSVRATTATSSVISYDSTDSGLIWSEPAPFAIINEIPFGDSTMYTYVEAVNAEGTSVKMLVAPGFIVRAVGAFVGNKFHVSGTDAEVFQSATAKGAFILVNSLDTTGLPAGWTIQ